MHDIFLLTQKHDLTEYFTKQFPRIKTLPVKTQDRKIDREKLRDMLSRTLTKYFFVIVDPNIRLDFFKFEYEPAEGEEQYVHIWNNNTNIRMYNREKVAEDIDSFTDDAVYTGKVNFKSHDFGKHSDAHFDVVFLSNYETFADGNFEKLKDKVPDAKRVNGVNGIFNAHKLASQLVDTSMVYIVDADAEIKDDFDFSFVPPESDRGFAHIWRSVNPINGLEYGYGGIKLFPTKMLRAAEFWKVDFTTSVSEGVKLIDYVSNVSRFNTSAFESWRSAFRECAKLASSVIENNKQQETEQRLDTWCNTGMHKSFGTYATEGAKAGKAYGEKNKHQVEALNCINNYEWLRDLFDSTYTDDFRYNRSLALYNRYFNQFQEE
jgi:hypothetical protein